MVWGVSYWLESSFQHCREPSPWKITGKIKLLKHSGGVVDMCGLFDVAELKRKVVARKHLLPKRKILTHARADLFVLTWKDGKYS